MTLTQVKNRTAAALAQMWLFLTLGIGIFGLFWGEF
jgi:hypothetical protein